MPPREIAYADVPALVGQEAGVSDWLTVTQARVNQFAEATGDHQWIHVDVERATREIGGPIAHGYLTLALIPYFAAQIVRIAGVARGVNYGTERVRFSGVVRVGARLRMRQTLLAAEPKAGGLQLRNRCTLEAEGEARPVCVAEILTLIYPEGAR